MVRKLERAIPMRDYAFMERFFADEPGTWAEIKDDLPALRLWAKAIKEAGWYNSDDTNTYIYELRIVDGGINIIRRRQ